MKINWNFVLLIAFIGGAYAYTKSPASRALTAQTPVEESVRNLCDENALLHSRLPVTGKVVEQFNTNAPGSFFNKRPPRTSYTLSDGRCEVTVLTSVFEQGKKVGIPSEQSLEGQYLTVSLSNLIEGELHGNIIQISRPVAAKAQAPDARRTWENIEDEVPSSSVTPAAAPAAQPHFRNYTITTTQTAEYMEQFRDYNDNLGFTDTRGEKFLIPASIRDKFPAKGTYTTMTLYAYNAEVYRISYR